MKLKTLALASALALAMSGCYVVPGTIQEASKPLEQGKYTVVSKSVSSKYFQVYLFGQPMAEPVEGSEGRYMYKEALAQAPGADALIEYCYDTKQLNLAWLVFQWYTLTGTAVKSK